MSDSYRMDGSPYPEGDEGLFQWAKDFEDSRGRIIEQNHLWNGIFLSTVWIGLNHRFGEGPPLIFETMAFNEIGEESFSFNGGSRQYSPDFYQRRYSTMAQAEDGHQLAKNVFGSVVYTLRWWLSVVMSYVFEQDSER